MTTDPIPPQSLQSASDIAAEEAARRAFPNTFAAIAKLEAELDRLILARRRAAGLPDLAPRTQAAPQLTKGDL